MKRRESREYVLQFLYGIDFLGTLKDDTSKLEEALSHFWADNHEGNLDIRAFAEKIIKGTIKNLEEIDIAIQATAEKWKLERMASIDRNIMRFATYELLFMKDIPPAVSINEALEIAKKYSAAESAAFINGILDRIAKR